jgi:enamine deaminase RidA (YjgF/YER057c/UK114 family)
MSAVTYINPPGAAPAQGLYSHAGVGNSNALILIAGQLSVDRSGDIVGRGNFAQQFHQVFSNLGDVLRGMNAGYSAIVKFTTFLVRSSDIDEFMDLRRKLFPTLFPDQVYPPNTLLVVSRLVKAEFLLEVEAVASVARQPTDAGK